MLDSPNPTQTAATSPGIADHLIGKHVIIRATRAGVHAGILAAHDGQTVRLTHSRRLWRWSAAKGHTLSGVALNGLRDGATKGWTKIAAPVACQFILDACEIIATTAEAQASIEGWPAHEP